MIRFDQSVRNAIWTTERGRRDIIPRYSNSLTRTQTRLHKCKTCGKTFNNVKTMERHVSLTHTGAKPVVCSVCDKRFHCRYHMTSHYPIHRESNLAQVEPFNRRRRGFSEPTTSQTSVGSIHRISRRFKHYLSEPTYKTFGTDQCFNVSGKDDPSHSHQKSLRVHISGSDHRVDSRGQSALNWKMIHRIPSIDPGSIDSIDSVMGPYRTIATDEKSGFLKSAEDRLISSRLDAISLAGWTVSTSYSGTRPILSQGRQMTNIHKSAY